MTASALTLPPHDPSDLFAHFRGNFATEFLGAAVSHLNVFGVLKDRALTFDALKDEIGIERRPANVLFTALRAMNLLTATPDGKLKATDQSLSMLVPGSAFDVTGYIGLASKSPGTLEMVARLKTNKPAGASDKDTGAAYIFREGVESAMEKESSARFLTLALSGRAKLCAPALALNVPWNETGCLLDIGGGSGIYSIAVLQARPKMRAIVWDRPEVLKVAGEFAKEYGVADRLELRPGDMFADAIPRDANTILLSNILHDWDDPECIELLRRCKEAIPADGSVLIHDVFLNDALDGPLGLALYSGALFSLTEGRAYSAAEYRTWLRGVGLKPSDQIIPTLAHFGVIPSVK